jgi:hypothetical protein
VGTGPTLRAGAAIIHLTSCRGRNARQRHQRHGDDRESSELAAGAERLLDARTTLHYFATVTSNDDNSMHTDNDREGA